jgi:hypothetical protein
MEIKRMLACIAIAMTCVFAGFVARQPDETASYENCKSIKKLAEIVRSTGKHYPADYPTYYTDEAGCNPPKWYATLKRPEWLQVIVAAIGIAVIAWQGFLTRRAAQATEIAARAAKDNIELIISKERARLRIKLSDLKLVPEGELRVYLVNFTVNIFGTTPAFITDTGCSGAILPPEAINDAETGDRAMIPLQGFPDLIPPNSQPIHQFTIFYYSGEETEGMLEEVRADRFFVMIRGFIKYKDVFDRARETNFRYVWKYEDFTVPPSTERWGHWERCGPPDHNKET